jgi:hypothetical protein
MSFTNSLYHSNKSKKEITMTGKFADLWRFVITYSILIYHHSNSFYPSNNISPYFVPFYNADVDLNNSGICMVFGNYHLNAHYYHHHHHHYHHHYHHYSQKIWQVVYLQLLSKQSHNTTQFLYRWKLTISNR